MPHTYTHSLFEDLIKTPRGNMNLTDQVFEYHSAFQNITILSRLGLLIEMQPGGFVLAPWLSDRKWQNGKKFTEAFDRLLNLSINSSIMAMELPRAYVRALDDTARYSKNVMEALYPRIPNLFTWYDKNAGIYYPQRAEHLMSVYIDYHTVMRGTIRALLEAHVELHRKFDAIASELQTISIAVDFDNTLPRYKARQSKWQNSSKGYYIPLLNPYARRLAVAEAYDYFVVLNETLVRTFDMVKRSECELSCTLPRVATYQSEAYGPPDVADSVEEVRRLERNLSPMATQEQTALKLRDYFQVGARQCEDVIERLSAAWLRKQREASWVLWQKLKKPPPTPRKRRAASATVVDKQTSGTTAAETGTGAGVDDTASSTIEEPESSTPEETESRVTDEPESSATDEPEHSTADEEEECCTEEEECSADD
ncbi:hypothetical protein MMC26_004229 [Xylographa opegraphella]|nr:hypothetical protein [Xylographa opegraphella]